MLVLGALAGFGWGFWPRFVEWKLTADLESNDDAIRRGASNALIERRVKRAIPAIARAFVKRDPDALKDWQTKSVDDHELALSFQKLTDLKLKKNLDSVSEALVHTKRWRAGMSIALFNMLELSMNVSPTGLPWVTSNAKLPELGLVLPDGVATRVTGSIPVSAVDAPDGLLAQAYSVHDQASRLPSVDGAPSKHLASPSA